MDTDSWLTPEIVNRAQEPVPASSPTSGSEEAALRRVLLDFLEILDSLDRITSLAYSKQLAAVDWNKQFEALQTQVIQTLEQSGLTFDNSLGESFDPERHEAVGRVERDDIPHHTITEVLGRGCEWHGKHLRAARVIVSCHPKTEVLDQKENSS